MKFIPTVCWFFIVVLSADNVKEALNPRIIGGTVCKIWDHRFVVSIRSRNMKHMCGGTLLNSYWVMSAAHCVRRNSLVAAGLNYFTGFKEYVSIQVADMYPHPEYDRKTVDNDIALYRLGSPLQEDGHFIKYVRLPDSTSLDDVTLQCEEALAMGWGIKHVTDEKASVTLQTDYSRHLDGIAKEVERLSSEVIQESLIVGETEKAIELIAQWEAYRDVKDTTNQTMEEELKLFQRKITKLTDILTVLKNIAATETKTVLEALEKKLCNIAKSIESEGSLNAGGKFEWVDSILVKCLQDGCWLLVDNVNLCSSAVLDRLNALLEPHGVLTMSERGVDQFGNMIEITPHKDFRMFFTMDPKNGEISRAMRNRGIEIYILDDNESGKFNQLDRMSQINLQGLEFTPHIKFLMKIHTFLSELILGEKPTVKELLQASSLISQQLTCNMSLFQAFFSTVLEVYYKTRSQMEFDCNDAVSTIKEEIEKIFDEHKITEAHAEVFDDSITLKTQNIGLFSTIEKVKQQSTMLVKQLYQHAGYNLEMLNLFVAYYSVSSVDDLDTRHLYIKSKLRNGNHGYLLDNLYKIVFEAKTTTDQQLPLDHNWLPETLYQNKSPSLSNKLNLGLLLTSYYLLERVHEEELKADKTKQVTLLDYMREKELGKIEDKFNDTVINNYLDLIKAFDEYLGGFTSKLADISNDNVILVLRLALWRFALHKCTLINIKKLSASDQYNILVNLSIHYKWFYKNAVRHISEITKVDLPKALEDILERINSKMDRHFSVAQKLGRYYQKNSNRPPPFVSNDQLKFVAEYESIKQCYDLNQKGNDAKKILNAFRAEKQLRNLLIEIKSKLDSSDVSEQLVLLKSLHETCNLVQEEYSTFELELFPVNDILTQLEVKTGFTDTEATFDNNVLLPTDFCGTLVLYHRTKDARLLHEIMKSYYLYLMNSASAKPNLYLTRTDGKEVVLSCFAPKLTYFLNALLVKVHAAENSARITLGNFRDLLKQHNTLSLTLWRNFHQLSEEKYDYLNCEMHHITKAYRNFITELSNSLKIISTPEESSQKITSKLIEFLEQMKITPKSPESDDELHQLSKHLKTCSLDLTKLENSTDMNEKILIISDLYMEIGFLKATLNSKLSLIDPLMKKTLKRQYCEEATETFESMKKCYEIQNEVYSNTIDTLHAYHKPIQRILEELSIKDQQLSEYVAVRPENVSYETVLRVINHAFNTIMSESDVTKTSSSLNYLILNVLDALQDESDIDYKYIVDTLTKHESTVASYENLIHDWTRYKTSYPDVLEPLLSNVTQFLYGFKMKLSVLKKCLTEYDYMKCGVNINEDMLNLVKLPILDETQSGYTVYLEKFTSRRVNNFVNYILKDAAFPHLKNQENFRLLKCGVQETFNNCIIDAKCADILNKNPFMQFNNIINIFVDAYNKQQQKKELEQKEADSLYKTKTKCDDKMEEEQIADELKQIFPNYHSIDFADFEKDAKLDDTIPATDVEYVETISYKDLEEVVQLHISLMKNYTRTEWLNPSKNKKISHDFLRPLVEKFKTFSQILDRSVHSLDYTMDKKLIGSLNVLLAVTKQYGETHALTDQTASPTRIVNKKTSDFYKDSNVEEVKSCYHILEELRIHINRLLDEWPEQPTLKTIILIIDRIYNFDINSPISRFLTGFEILLTKCHEWEQVAHSGISLSQHYKSLTDQIISWRKLELTMWKDLLNRTYERLNEPLSKWWLYLYNTMRQFVVEKLYTEQELIETLQTFISKSNLAEFQGRLDLLYTFHCHATYLERTKESELFTSILWNLYNYFDQFSSTIANKIKDLRSPIEKKLRDYVKIVRWKDINYWAIKETVDKTHKILHKYMREFQDVLEQPVASLLHNTTSANYEGENVGIWDRPQRHSPKKYHYTLDADAYMAKLSLAKKFTSSEVCIEEGILSKTESYFLKSRKLCKQTILATQYPSLVKSLDNFITEIIENSTHLQKLEVDKTLPKEKQKSQAKSILQQKHRALADLFKTLGKIGLSFRSGIVESKLKNPASDFVLKPIDLNASFNHINYGSKEEKILTIWDSCEIYYVRSLMRSDVLETALKTPAKDLGLQNIERCKGFSVNLMTISQKQKQDLIESSRVYYYLRYYLKQMNDCCDAKQFTSATLIDNLGELLKNITIVMEQYKIILNTCPGEDSFSNETIEIPLLKTDMKEVIMYKHDSVWSKASNLIATVSACSSKLRSQLLKWKGCVSSVEYDLISPKYVPITDLSIIEKDLTSIFENIAELKQIFGNTAITSSISWLEQEITAIKQQLFEENAVENLDIEQFKNEIVAFIEQILVVMQNLYKKYNSVDTSEEKPASEEEQLKDDQLNKLLVETLSSDIALLEMKKILRRTHKISKILLNAPPQHRERLKTLAQQYLPILEQLMQLYQYFITQQVSAYRVTCKMCSVLLNIFIDLASKGFCIPPEFSDEMDGEGISKPSDGLGLGEGEGERDVSDRIESEDQLDDAQPAGQEKEKEEDKDCKEDDKGIEMSEDFDSKLQDKEKNEDDSEDNSGDSDANEQMGETEKGADQLDQEIWGSDQEEAEEDQEEDTEEKEEKGESGEKDGEDQIGAKDEASKRGKDEEKPDQSSPEDKEKNKKDINELEEPEFDDDQIDPHHGKQPELPEPEPMDLPDDLQLDDGEEKDNETQEENPFDIDKMKEDNIPDDKNEEEDSKENKEEQRNDEEKDFSSDDEDIKRDETEDNAPDVDDESNNDKEEKTTETNETKEDDETEKEAEYQDNEDTVLDQTKSHQDNVEAMEVDNAEAEDNTEASQSENQKSNQPIEELCQEDRPDQEGVGQSQMEESTSGHSAQTTAAHETKSVKQDQKEDQNKRQRPGETDLQRSLGDVDEPVQKKLKTIDATKKDEEEDEEENVNRGEENAEMFQHIKEAKEAETQVLDVATKEQAESQKKEAQNKENEDEDEPADSSKDLPKEEEEVMEVENIPAEKSEKTEKIKENKTNKKQHPEGDVLEDIEDINIDGEVAETATVQRGTESFHHTQYANNPETTASRLSMEEINNLRMDVEKQLMGWNEPPTTSEAEQAWHKISSVTSSLAQDLSEQLRLVLEPTQASRLKGDFRTGRRINMRKVIPYIASQFRKDKIWLRRTKPSKREYQIVMAIDDSSSMADNHSKELAFESVALISKALTLLESGQLSVVSFGETTDVVHKLTDQFTDKSGVKLLQKFKFCQNKTCVAKLVDFATEMFNQSQLHSIALNAKLLVIVSDGRGVFSEGETYVKQAVRRAKLSNIFMVFVIIDNPENKNSVLDIRMPVFKDGKLLGIQSYMDVFPFSFYIILRDINSLPSVLSDALRQWFEVVSNLDK